MRCLIADLRVDILAERGIASLCKPYLSAEDASLPADVVIDVDASRFAGSIPGDPPQELLDYMFTGEQFYRCLLRFDGMLLHASAVAVGGKAYLFSGKCGTGKSTHTRLYQRLFPDAVVFNDDKPALRCVDGVWYAYGTPWCGSDHINVNLRVPLAGICFLVQAKENRIRRLSAAEAVTRFLSQTIYRLPPAAMDKLLTSLDGLMRRVPVFELENRPEPEAARLSYETMKKAAEECGL